MKRSTKVEKPWGNFEQFVLNKKCTVKILTVNPGHVLSKQSHKGREELWIMLDEGLTVEIEDKTFNPKKGEQAFIPKEAKHRLSSRIGGRVLEISFGEFDEKDIVRYEDNYGRI